MPWLAYTFFKQVIKYFLNLRWTLSFRLKIITLHKDIYLKVFVLFLIIVKWNCRSVRKKKLLENLNFSLNGVLHITILLSLMITEPPTIRFFLMFNVFKIISISFIYIKSFTIPSYYTYNNLIVSNDCLNIAFFLTHY